MLSLQNSVHHLATPFFETAFLHARSLRVVIPSLLPERKKGGGGGRGEPKQQFISDKVHSAVVSWTVVESVKLGAKPSSPGTRESNRDVVAMRVGCHLCGSVKSFAQK